MDRKKEGVCIYCYQRTVVNRDHVFPKAWYPDSTPPDIQRWTVPSCAPCNSAHGENEEDLLIRLGLCLAPDEAIAPGIAEKANRAISRGNGSNSRDDRARELRRAEILKTVSFSKTPSSFGVLPGFGLQPNVDYEGTYVAVLLPAEGLKRLGEKIIRGITYKETEKIIPGEYEIGVWINEDRSVADFIELTERHGVKRHFGPGIRATRAEAAGDPLSAIFRIEIWGRLKLNGSVLPREFASSSEG